MNSSITYTQLKKDFIKILNGLSYSRHKWEVWRDFTSMSAMSIQQVFNKDDKIEERYMDISNNYDPAELNKMAELLAITVQALEMQMSDFLGEIFQELELASKWHGQFFTPYGICRMVAQTTFHDLTPFENGNTVTLSEPACGGGAMVIAACEYLREKGINYQTQLKITAVDVDLTACHMAYIQLSLLGCQAVVVHGNTLSLEEYGHFITPLSWLPIPTTKTQPTIEASESKEFISGFFENAGL